ncbi:MAG: uroporphyrinogen-III C-methyltransferase [candidate division NC10 bacterium]|nr:uroporphyrinogen-III C-methyltransferase [candidate division NC10 bacterium]
MPKAGKVYLVGAGPGDPGLLTLRGKSCLEEAEVVVYDALANPTLLRHARPEVECIFVGKRAGAPGLPQEEINRLLVARCEAGQVVVRLKGGDPFIFGRGGEEAEALAAAGCAFEVVPGVTSAVAVPAYAGIPLTHRDLAATVAFVTGHEDPTKEESGVPWDALARGIGTLVFLMGVGTLPTIARRLVAHGRSPETPVAVIRWGTTPRQQTVVGTLADIAERVQAAGLTAPAITVVGEAVRLRQVLNWFERKPLFGKTVVVTRAREQASAFAQILEAAGAEVLEAPAIALVPPASWGPLDEALARPDTYAWVLFTSANGVRAFAERLMARGLDWRALGACRLAAIGTATAEALHAYGMRADRVAEEFTAEGLLAAFAEEPVAGKRFLLPRAEVARETLPEELRRRGAAVDVVPVYRTVPDRSAGLALREALTARRVAAVTFTSSSTVENFIETLKGEDLPALLDGVWIACIGPVTAAAARRHGLRPDILPATHTIPALAEALVNALGTPPAR